MNIVQSVVNAVSPVLMDFGIRLEYVAPDDLDPTVNHAIDLQDASQAYPPLKLYEQEVWQATSWCFGKRGLLCRPAVIRDAWGMFLAMCRVQDLANGEIVDKLGHRHALLSNAMEEAIELKHHLSRR